MPSHAWLLGQRNFWPVSILNSSYNLPKAGALGLRNYVPNVFINTTSGVVLADPDTKISGIPLTHPPSKEPQSEIIPEKLVGAKESAVKHSRKRAHHHEVKIDEPGVRFKPIRLTKEEIKHLPQPDGKKNHGKNVRLSINSR